MVGLLQQLRPTAGLDTTPSHCVNGLALIHVGTVCLTDARDDDTATGTASR